MKKLLEVLSQQMQTTFLIQSADQVASQRASHGFMPVPRCGGRLPALDDISDFSYPDLRQTSALLTIAVRVVGQTGQDEDSELETEVQ